MRGRQGEGVPRHRSAALGGYKTSHHPEESRRGNRRGPVHAHRAPASQDDFFRTEGPGPNWRPEELFLRREPGELFVRRNPRIRSGGSNLVDLWPIDAVLGTQHVSCAVPLRIGHPGYQLFGQAEVPVVGPFSLTTSATTEFGMLPLRAGVVGLAVEPEKLGHDGAIHTVEEVDFPPEGSRRESHRSQCMADIVLAVPERTLAILPGLPPKNGRQPHEE